MIVYPVNFVSGGAAQSFLNTCREMRESILELISFSHNFQSSRCWASQTVRGCGESEEIDCDISSAKLLFSSVLWRVHMCRVLA